MKLRHWELLPLAVLLVAGCSSQPPLPDYDSGLAEATLIAALDAWKQGYVKDLAKREPPIRFEDEDYRSGLHLSDYRLADREIPLRPFDDVQVTLLLRNRRGEIVEKTAVYQVACEPQLAVLRSD